MRSAIFEFKWNGKKQDAFELKALPLIERLELTAIDLSIMFNTYGDMMRLPGPALLQVMEKQTIQAMGLSDARASAEIFYNCAQIGWKPGDEMISCLTERICTSMTEVSARIISNTLWGYATLGVDPGEGLMGTLERCALSKTGKMNADELANMFWALVKLGRIPNAELASMIQSQALSRVHGFSSRGIANILWAYATSGIRPVQQLEKVMQQQAVLKAKDFSPEEFQTMLQGHATLGWNTKLSLTDYGKLKALVPSLTESVDHNEQVELLEVKKERREVEGRLGDLKSWVMDLREQKNGDKKFVGFEKKALPIIEKSLQLGVGQATPEAITTGVS